MHLQDSNDSHAVMRPACEVLCRKGTSHCIYDDSTLESRAGIETRQHLNTIQTHHRCPQVYSARVAACPQ